METTKLVARVNQGSMRKLAEKTGQGIVNRFGPQIAQVLNEQRWGDDYDLLEAEVKELLLAMLPTIAGTVYQSFGYDIPDHDQRSAPIFEGTDEPA